MFLTAEDLEQLTGKRRPSAQSRWLRDHGWQFTLNGNGRPVVHEIEAERQLCGGRQSRHHRTTPDLDALNG